MLKLSKKKKKKSKRPSKERKRSIIPAPPYRYKRGTLSFQFQFSISVCIGFGFTLFYSFMFSKFSIPSLKMGETYPPTLNSLFDPKEKARNIYDPLRLTSAEALSILKLPLARTVFGHGRDNDNDDNGNDTKGRDNNKDNGQKETRDENNGNKDIFDRMVTGELSFTEYVANNAKSILKEKKEEQRQRSQLLHIGLAALFSFLQSNVTGPPLDFNPEEVLLPRVLREDSALRTSRARIIGDLSVDGEAVYQLAPNIELFAIARALLVDIYNTESSESLALSEESKNGIAVAKLARMRTNFLHQKMLSEVTGTLQTAIYTDLEDLGKEVLGDDNEAAVGVHNHDQGKFLLERATIHTLHGFDTRARADLEKAANVRGFEFALTGKLGKRTKFQDRDISQLVVLAKSGVTSSSSGNGNGNGNGEQVQEQDQKQSSGPENLNLNDDTLLESISFTKDNDISNIESEKAGTVQDKSSLPPALASLDPGHQPMLDPVDSAILLALASAITNTSPDYGLTREETLPYAERVLEGGSSNWQVYTQALLVRSRIEGYKTRTVERSVLQMQALVDQVIADTAAIGTGPAEQQTPATTFLPRPGKTDSAPATERLEYIWLMDFSTRWDLEAELASRWVKLGGLRTALEIYERLQMWAEASLCYAATDQEEKARKLVRKQLYLSSGKEREDEKESDDKFEGPERSQLPANAPRLFCILGDIDTDPAMYERAWEVSGKRYSRAQRSLARYYLTLKPPALERAEDAYRKSLHINRLNHGAWFAMGCVQLELEKWEDAIESFRNAVKLEETDAEAWSNLAAAIMRVPTSGPTNLTEDEQQQGEQHKDPYRQKREALIALHRASQLKPTDHRIWDNVLTVAGSIPPPTTPYAEIILSQKRLIDLLGTKKGEKAIDLPILGMLVDYLVRNYEYEDLFSPMNTSNNGQGETQKFLRSGSVPGQIITLIDDNIVPLITHSAPLWLLVSRVELFRKQPSKAFEAHEKAWRAVVAFSAQGAFQMGDEQRWNDVVRATEKLVRDGYAKIGPMEKEKENENEGEGDDGNGEELVAKDWRFKSRSAIRGIMGKGRDFWEDTEGWKRLKLLQSEVSGGL